jgi:mono/diheme cytochrome c family protein
VLGFTAFWLLSAPRPLPASAIPIHAGNVANGEVLYTVGGCRNCHKPDAEQPGLDPNLPSGGFPLKTPIGVLYPPNLTPDPQTGLGNWSDLEFVNAVQRGISKSGQHLIPAFPYTSYAAMPVGDVLDIKAYLMSLPPVASPRREPDIPIALLLRRGLGLWKFLGLDNSRWQPDTSQSPSWNRGSYLVNGPGHCGECHTPRNLIMVRDESRMFAGGPHPEGQGKVPSMRSLIERGRYKDKKDLAIALQFGEEFGYENMAAGGMRQVQINMSKLPQSDIDAIAEYLISLK